MKSFENKDKNYITHILPTFHKNNLRIYEHKDSIVFKLTKYQSRYFIISFKKKYPCIYYINYGSIKNLGAGYNNSRMLEEFILMSLAPAWQEDHRRKKLHSCRGCLHGLRKFIWAKLREKGYDIPKVNFTKFSCDDIVTLASYPYLAKLPIKESAIKFRRTSIYIMSWLAKVMPDIMRNSKDFNDFTRRIFLSKNPKLKKILGTLVQNTEVDKIILIYTLRQLIPVEYYPDILKNNLILNSIYRSLNSYDIVTFRKILKHYNSKRIKILLSNQYTREWVISDMIYLYRNYSDKIILPEKPKNFVEIHDSISRQHRKLKHKDFELEKSKLKELDGEKINDMQVIIPKTNHQLIDWGEQMSNCIGGYGTRNTGLLGIFRNEKLIYNLQIENKRVLQFFGPHNSTPDQNDMKNILNFLEDRKIINKKEVSLC